MSPDLKIIIYEEKNVLKKLLSLLDEQHNVIIDNKIFKIDEVSNELELVTKELAEIEIKRISIVKNEISMKEIVYSCDDENIRQCYEEIINILKSIELQKGVNETLIKQKLFFSKKMMNFIKPSKKIGTYNAYGRVDK